MSESSPAFQFYPDDWLSSSSVAAMSAEQRGCYIMLLCYLWRDGVVPDDDTILASLVRVHLKRWRVIKDGVMRPCTLTERGWVNDRLESEREKQVQWREQSRRAGQSSAKARASRFGSANPRSNREPDVNRAVHNPLEPFGNSPSPSPSPSSVQTHVQTRAREDTSQFLLWWGWAYREFRGAPYAFTVAREQGQVESLLKTYPLPRLKQMAMVLWHDQRDQWLQGTDRGLAILHAKANLIAGWCVELETKQGHPLKPAPEPDHDAATPTA